MHEKQVGRDYEKNPFCEQKTLNDYACQKFILEKNINDATNLGFSRVEYFVLQLKRSFSMNLVQQEINVEVKNNEFILQKYSTK